jgi:hypothetical protein
MRRLVSTVALVVFTSLHAALAAPFTQGNVVISQVGDPDNPRSGSASIVHILEISPTDPDGTVVQDIVMPTVATGKNHRFTLTGSMREGFLTRSANGLFLTIGGYDCDLGTASPGRTLDAATIPRVIARIDPFGIVDTSTAVTDMYYDPQMNNSQSGIHGTTSTDGRHFWTAGRGSSGAIARVRYVAYGATTSTVLTTGAANDPRSVDTFNGQLYAVLNPSGNRGVHAIGTGLPTSGTNTVALVPTVRLHPVPNSSSPYQMYWRDADTVYLSDDDAVAQNGGIHKFVRDTVPESPTFGQLTFRYVLREGLPSTGTTQACKGMAGRVNAQGQTELFVITAEEQQGAKNRLMTVVDTGCPGGGLSPDGLTLLQCPETFTTLQTSPTGADFRGVAIAPRECVGDECLGQCCSKTGCEDTTQAACTNGQWMGLGSSCALGDTCPIVCGVPFADDDADGDVDMDDFGAFQRCFSGEGAVVSGGCQCFDRPEEGFPAGDDDVDQTDFTAFTNCASRANVPPGC